MTCSRALKREIWEWTHYTFPPIEWTFFTWEQTTLFKGLWLWLDLVFAEAMRTVNVFFFHRWGWQTVTATEISRASQCNMAFTAFSQIDMSWIGTGAIHFERSLIQVFCISINSTRCNRSEKFYKTGSQKQHKKAPVKKKILSVNERSDGSGSPLLEMFFLWQSNINVLERKVGSCAATDGQFKAPPIYSR